MLTLEQATTLAGIHLMMEADVVLKDGVRQSDVLRNSLIQAGFQFRREVTEVKTIAESVVGLDATDNYSNITVLTQPSVAQFAIVAPEGTWEVQYKDRKDNEGNAVPREAAPGYNWRIDNGTFIAVIDLYGGRFSEIMYDIAKSMKQLSMPPDLERIV